MIYLYVVGTKSPQSLARDHAEQQVVLVDAGAEFEFLKLTRAKRHAGPAVPVELRQQISDDVFLIIAFDDHAVDAGSESAQIRGQRHSSGHESVQRHFPQAIHDRLGIVCRAIRRRRAVYLLGEVHSVRDRVFYQSPTAQR